ncbi:ATP phosphoribosyltransferase, partial [bacterium]|nr:ATP phosphoribosyltransferase [bacterium]
DDKNVVIHVVVDKDKIYESVYKLKQLGGQGILIMTVDQMVR